MNKNGQIAVGTIAMLVIIYLLYSNKQKDKKIIELEETLESNDLITNKIKQKLLQLVENHPHIDVDVKEELKQIAMQIGIQQETKAILSLAKIIEDLLKKLFKDNIEFAEFIKSKNKRKATFADHLDFAKEKGIIAQEDYHLISVVKLIRNEEAHELNVIKDKSKLIGCFLSGIAVVISLYNLVKATLLDKEKKTVKSLVEIA